MATFGGNIVAFIIVYNMGVRSVAYTGTNLTATYSNIDNDIILTNGIPIINISDNKDGLKYYKINVPPAKTNLIISTSGGSGDVDLYVKYNQRPTISSYDYRPWINGNIETVSVISPTSGWWYIMLKGYAAYAGTNLTATYSGTTSPHFQTVWSGSPYQAMNVFLESATFNGSQLSNGDEIAVYDGDNCVGVTILSGLVSPYVEIKTSTNNPATTGTDGFISGNTITYRLWKASTSTELNSATVTYNPTSPIPKFTSLATAFVNLDFQNSSQQIIQIPANTWYIFSLNVTPPNATMQSLLQNILPSLVKVQDEDGNAIVKFPNGNWFYGISNWLATEGYYIYVNSASSLTVLGNAIALPLAMQLNTNKWNIIGYPHSTEQNALTYFNSLITSNKLVKVQDYQGSAIVKFPNGTWYNGIGNIKPGEGYYVYVNGDVNFTSSQQINYTKIKDTKTKQLSKKGIVIKKSQDLSFYKDKIHKQKYLPMNVFIFSTDDKVKEIAAYNKKGILIDASLVRNNNEINNRFAELKISKDNPLTNKIDGFLDNEDIVFKAWDGVNEKEIYPTLIGKNDLTFKQMSTLFLKINEQSFEKIIPKEYMLYNNYPNPFNPTTVIEFNLPQDDIVSLYIYNALGELVDKIIAGELKVAGKYKYLWNAKNKASGVYFLQLKTSNKIFTNKMILLK